MEVRQCSQSGQWHRFWHHSVHAHAGVLSWNHSSAKIYVWSSLWIYAERGVMGNCRPQRLAEELMCTPPESQKCVLQPCISHYFCQKVKCKKTKTHHFISEKVSQQHLGMFAYVWVLGIHVPALMEKLLIKIVIIVWSNKESKHSNFWRICYMSLF